MEITIDGLRINYVDEGQGAEVLLLHGWGAPAQAYRLIIDHLSLKVPGSGARPSGVRRQRRAGKAVVSGRLRRLCNQSVSAVGLSAPVLIGHCTAAALLSS